MRSGKGGDGGGADPAWPPALPAPWPPAARQGPGKSPVGYEHLDEITVTRQLVIGGRSKYLINGKVAEPRWAGGLAGGLVGAVGLLMCVGWPMEGD